MASDFWDYVAERERECAELSVSAEELQCVEEEGSHGSRGQIHGHIPLLSAPGIDAYLDIKEVVLVEGHAHREEYAYYLIVNEDDLWGHERDPQHAPHEVHFYTRQHDANRYPCKPISFKAAIELAWEHVTYVHTHGLEDDYDPLAPD